MRTLFLIVNGIALGYICATSAMNGQYVMVAASILAFASNVGYIFVVNRTALKGLSDIKKHVEQIRKQMYERDNINPETGKPYFSGIDPKKFNKKL